ncbi:MAG: hypothetical protein ACRBK7_20545 [Acidimicrobiales bacterium]
MATWTPWAGADLGGEIRRAKPDQPWFFGAWHPTLSFQPYESLFEEELSFLDSMDEMWDEWEQRYQLIRQVLLLKTPDGIDVAEWVLHVDGEEAFLSEWATRYSHDCSDVKCSEAGRLMSLHSSGAGPLIKHDSEHSRTNR